MFQSLKMMTFNVDFGIARWIILLKISKLVSFNEWNEFFPVLAIHFHICNSWKNRKPEIEQKRLIKLGAICICLQLIKFVMLLRLTRTDPLKRVFLNLSFCAFCRCFCWLNFQVFFSMKHDIRYYHWLSNSTHSILMDRNGFCHRWQFGLKIEHRMDFEIGLFFVTIIGIANFIGKSVCVLVTSPWNLHLIKLAINNVDFWDDCSVCHTDIWHWHNKSRFLHNNSSSKQQ